MKILFIFSIALLWALPAWNTAWAEEKSLSRDQREKMASLHEAIAGCLKSERSVSECREEIRTKCRETLSEKECGKFRRMMMVPGRGKDRPHRERRQRMQTPPANTPNQSPSGSPSDESELWRLEKTLQPA